MQGHRLPAIIVVALATFSAPASATNSADPSERSAVAELSEHDIANALRLTLADSAQVAIDELGRAGGFWDHEARRIPLPDQVLALAEATTLMGEGALVNRFALALNRAAEQLVPASVEILGRTISTLPMSGLYSILCGGQNAATQHLITSRRTYLHDELLPLMREASARAEVVGAYQAMADRGRVMLGLVGPAPTQDLDGYLLDQILTRLFDRMAERERAIREDPSTARNDLISAAFSLPGQRGVPVAVDHDSPPD